MALAEADRRPKRGAAVATRSEAFVCALDGGGAALARQRVGESAAPEGRDGVLVDSHLTPEAREQRAYVALERFEHDAVRAEHVSLSLRLREPLLVDQERLRVRR